MEGCKKTQLCTLRKTSLLFSHYPPGLKLWLQVEISWREELKERAHQVLEGKEVVLRAGVDGGTCAARDGLLEYRSSFLGSPVLMQGILTFSSLERF